MFRRAPCSRTKNCEAATGAGSCHTQRFVCFGDNVIDHCLHIVCAFPHHELSIGASALAHDPLDQVALLVLIPQLLHFGSDELQHLVSKSRS